MFSKAYVVGMFVAGAAAQCNQPPRIRTDSGDFVVSLGCSSSMLLEVAGGPTVNLSGIGGLVQNALAEARQEATDARIAQSNAITEQLDSLNRSTVSQISYVTDALTSTMQETTSTMQETIVRLETELERTNNSTAEIRRCNIQGKVLGADGACRFASPTQCPAFPQNTSTRNFRFVGGRTFAGSTVYGDCVWEENRKYYGQNLTTTCLPTGEWEEHGERGFPPCSPVDNGCVPGSFMSRAPSRTTNTNCTVCPARTFQTIQNYTGTSCSPHRRCGRNTFVSFAGNSTANRVCQQCPSNTFQVVNDFNGSNCMGIQYRRIQGTGCSASSRYNSAYDCRYAYNNNWADGGGRAWATRGQGAGSWYRMTFRSSYIGRLRFRQRNCGCEWYRRVQLEFSNGQRRTVNLRRAQDGTYTFDWVGPVTWVMMRFDQQWSRVNNGANEIEFQGISA